MRWFGSDDSLRTWNVRQNHYWQFVIALAVLMEKETYSVLVVDDSEDDRFFMRNVLHRFPRFKLIGEMCDGEDAILYLSGRDKFRDRAQYPLPDLMLLDLKMPRKTGFDVLEWLRTRSFPGLTVIVLSSSPLAEDVGASLSLGAHGFWTKTSDPKKQNQIVHEVEAILDKRWTSSCLR